MRGIPHKVVLFVRVVNHIKKLLERRLRIAAGSLVAGGAALAAFGPSPLWQQIGMWLAGFIGSGLVFAGVTDTCGMGMLIAKMPWNQAPTTCKSKR